MIRRFKALALKADHFRNGSKSAPPDAADLGPFNSQQRTLQLPAAMSARCRYCCKSLFASLNTNFPGRTRGDQTII